MAWTFLDSPMMKDLQSLGEITKKLEPLWGSPMVKAAQSITVISKQLAILDTPRMREQQRLLEITKKLLPPGFAAYSAAVPALANDLSIASGLEACSGTFRALERTAGIVSRLRVLPGMSSALTKNLGIFSSLVASPIASPAIVKRLNMASGLAQEYGLPLAAHALGRPAIDPWPPVHLGRCNPEVSLPLAPPHMQYAYALVAGFESFARDWIEQWMTGVFGPQWTKHRVPGDVRKRWEERGRDACNARMPSGSLISYADFMEILDIIVRKDNWEELFRLIFPRLTFVQESFTRLHAIRCCTMHSRVLSDEQVRLLKTELALLVEAMRNAGGAGLAS